MKYKTSENSAALDTWYKRESRYADSQTSLFWIVELTAVWRAFATAADFVYCKISDCWLQNCYICTGYNIEVTASAFEWYAVAIGCHCEPLREKSLILYSTDLNNSHITTDFLYYFLETRVENFTLFKYLMMIINVAIFEQAKLIQFIFNCRTFRTFFNLDLWVQSWFDNARITSVGRRERQNIAACTIDREIFYLEVRTK